MNHENYLDKLLSPEEHNRLPDAVAVQRDKWIETLETFETEHPQDDNGASTDALIGLISMRAVLDIVTRNMFLDTEPSPKGATDDAEHN